MKSFRDSGYARMDKYGNWVEGAYQKYNETMRLPVIRQVFANLLEQKLPTDISKTYFPFSYKDFWSNVSYVRSPIMTRINNVQMKKLFSNWKNEGKRFKVERESDPDRFQGNGLSGMEGGKFDVFDDLIIPVGTKVGEPFKQTTGLNPFTLGFKLGQDVIAPALMKRFPPRGRGMEGGHWTPPMASHLEKEMRNYQNIAHHLGQHLAESGSQDPKDQIGYYHFSKEAERIRDLIADIV
jgi:hypothetical protein